MTVIQALSKASQAFHPGYYILEEIQERGWSILQFKEILGWNDEKANQILDESTEFRLSCKEANDLGRLFGVSPDLFLNLYIQWKAKGK